MNIRFSFAVFSVTAFLGFGAHAQVSELCAQYVMKKTNSSSIINLQPTAQDQAYIVQKARQHYMECEKNPTIARTELQ